MVKREQLASLDIIDGPGKDASSDALDFSDTTVSFLVKGEKVRIAATVFGKELNDKPTVRRKFKLQGMIISGEYAGKRYIAYIDLCAYPRTGKLVILGEPLTPDDVQDEIYKKYLVEKGESVDVEVDKGDANGFEQDRRAFEEEMKDLHEVKDDDDCPEFREVVKRNNLLVVKLDPTRTFESPKQILRAYETQGWVPAQE